VIASAGVGVRCLVSSCAVAAKAPPDRRTRFAQVYSRVHFRTTCPVFFLAHLDVALTTERPLDPRASEPFDIGVSKY
jgi:hypothetical protein